MKLIIKLGFFCCLMLLRICFANGQAKKPTIMVVPSDAWCFQRGFVKEYNNQGDITRIPDYKRAFQESTDLIAVVSKIDGLMADRGFPLKNMEAAIKTLESERAEDAALTSKNGSSVSESPVDKLKKIAKADIIMQLTWDEIVTGPKKSIRFTLQGLDSYSNKEVATAEGTGVPSFSADISVLLEEAVVDKIDNFNTSLQSHFKEMFTNGREITIRIKKFESWDGDIEKHYAGEELGTNIESWIRSHAVNHRFNTTDATENMMLFEQVRIPIFDESGNALDARGFVQNLQKFLAAPPYSITNKLMMKGLGEAVIVLGDK